MDNHDYFHEMTARIHGIEDRLAGPDLPMVTRLRLKRERLTLIDEYNAEAEALTEELGKIGSGY